MEEPNVSKWIDWFLTTDRSVARTILGEAQISTIFLGIVQADEPFALWETMVMGGNHDGATRKCSGSRDQAEAMHLEVVALLQNNPPGL